MFKPNDLRGIDAYADGITTLLHKIQTERVLEDAVGEEIGIAPEYLAAYMIADSVTATFKIDDPIVSVRIFAGVCWILAKIYNEGILDHLMVESDMPSREAGAAVTICQYIRDRVAQ
jgi:hypothetical protein